MKNSKKDALYGAGREYKGVWAQAHNLDTFHFSTDAESAYRELRLLRIMVVLFLLSAGLGTHAVLSAQDPRWILVLLTCFGVMFLTGGFAFTILENSGTNLRKMARAWRQHRPVAATLNVDNGIECALAERLRQQGSIVLGHQTIGQKIRARWAKSQYNKVYDLAKALGYQFEYGRYLK